MRKYSILIIFIVLILNTDLSAQKATKKLFSEEELPVRHEFFIGGGVHTLGFQVRAIYGFLPNPVRTMNFLTEFGEIKHPKERLQTYDGLSILGGAPKAFIYGKQNNLFFLRLGYSEKYYLSAKNRRAVSVAVIYGGGFSLGMVRPYYLDLIYRNSGGIPTIVAEKYNETNKNKFLNPQEVDGPSNLSYGWNELDLAPGFFLKTGVLIDWGAFDFVVKDIEVGLAADFYFKKINMMVFEQNTPIFVNLYININLGVRFN